MTDYISRADAIETVCRTRCGDKAKGCPAHSCLVIEEFDALPSAELPKGDLISRADVLKYPIRLDHYDEVNGNRLFVYGVESVIEYVESLPSADADGEDLIIKGAKGIQDGLYNIKDGKLFKYKGKGGTVRTYPIVPSADAVHGEWVIRENGNKECSLCGHERQDGWDYFCGYCGARMKGGAE